MRVVAAVGGNALLRRGQRAEVANQAHNIAVAARALADLAADHELVVTHGNGPQVGLLALEAEAYTGVSPYPLDVLGAEAEGMIGYLLEQALANVLPGRRVATLLTQVVVDAADPAFITPSKPVGPVYAPAEAHRLAHERGWRVAPDGPYWRRVVPSPAPQRIVELDAIRILLDAGVIVICVGGGGVPVIVNAAHGLHGVEAVIDKDRSAELLATQLHADALLLLTDVPGIERDHGRPSARPLDVLSPQQLADLRLPTGSMAPKAQAAARFVTATGGFAAIGALEDAAAVLAGRAGTRIVADRSAALPGPRSGVAS